MSKHQSFFFIAQTHAAIVSGYVVCYLWDCSHTGRNARKGFNATGDLLCDGVCRTVMTVVENENFLHRAIIAAS